mgnify:CR=1 FL=1
MIFSDKQWAPSQPRHSVRNLFRTVLSIRNRSISDQSLTDNLFDHINDTQLLKARRESARASQELIFFKIQEATTTTKNSIKR